MKPEASIESPRFRRALDFALKWETTFDRKGKPVAENDPDDPGGLTKFGIDQRSHPNVDIRSLTKESAAAIYHRDYWLSVRAHELPLSIGEIVFDIAVNNGKSRAIRWLQEAVGVVADGFIGPKTLRAVFAHSGSELASTLLCCREKFYRRIARGRRAKYLKGWLNRNASLRKFAMSLSLTPVH